MKQISLILFGMMISSAVFSSSFIMLPKPISTYNSIEDILQTIDPNILPHVPYEEQRMFEFGRKEKTDSNYTGVLIQKALDIRNHIASRYSEDLSNFSDQQVIAIGIMLMPLEARDMFLGRVSNEQAFGCMMTALGAATGISALASAWTSGASASTILSVLKSILKIGYGWFAVGYAVYQFGDCVGWW